MTNPLVSVSIITYNQDHFIEVAIESVLMQKTSFEFEINIGNDGSSDKTGRICDFYAQKYPGKVKVYHRDRNNVPKHYIHSGRRNFIETLKTCNGKYIALLDGDDYWTDPFKLQKQVDFLESNQDFSLVFSNLKLINRKHEYINDAYIDSNKERSFQVYHKPPNEFEINELSKGNVIHTPTVLFRNWISQNKLPQYLNQTPVGDWPLHMFTAKFGKIKYQDEITAAYRISNNGVFSSASKIKRMEMSLLQYPYLINDKVFDDSIILYWKKILPDRILKYLELCSQSNIKYREEELLKVYSRYAPEILIDLVFLLINEKNDAIENIKKLLDTRAFRMIKKLSKIKAFLIK